MSDYHVETRRRSRSKTPFLRNEEDGNVPKNKKKAAVAPNVRTIVEETVEVTSSSSPSPTIITPSTKLAQTKTIQQKTKTSDYSSEDPSPESKAKKSAATQQKEMSSTTSTAGTTTSSTSTFTSSTIKVRKIKSAGGQLLLGSSSTPRADNNHLLKNFAAQYISDFEKRSAGGTKEITQNKMNTEFERSQQSEQLEQSGIQRNSLNRSQNRSFSRILSDSFAAVIGSGNRSADSAAATFGSDTNLNNGDLSDHLAYLEYKRAGEYWKRTPKTDYTYSELSPYRRQLAPGIIAMPNMSRRSLDNHDQRVNYMIDREPAKEDFIRRRYEAKQQYTKNRSEAERLTYDSGDEVDYSQFDNYRKRQSYFNGKNYGAVGSVNESWLARFITSVVTTITSVWSTISGAEHDDSALYRTRVGNEKRGFFGTIGHGLSSSIGALFRYVYLSISSVLYLDTWLLQSSNPENRNKKRFLLVLLLLLPLLLLAAWHLLDDNERAYYLHRTQHLSSSLVPLSLLASLRTTLYSTGATVKGLWQLPVFTRSFSSQESAAQENLQKALSAEEYENILNHVNSYVQQLVDTKLQEERRTQVLQSQRITPEQTQVIVRIMQENLERIAREKRAAEHEVKLSVLSEEEVERLAALVQLQLAKSGSWVGEQPVQLSNANLAEIKRLITEHIEINNHAHYTLLVERLDLDALLLRVLNAPQLATFIDARIDEKLVNVLAESSGDRATSEQQAQQQFLIDELNREIAFIKLALNDKLSENTDLQQSISKLQYSQVDLLERLQRHELSTDERFSALLVEIESKLATLKNDQFTLLNKQIKLTVSEILGFKQNAEGVQLNDADLQNWVRNTFVAKEYLEEQLLQLSNHSNAQLRAEIDQSSVLLLRDISTRLKREILQAVEAQQNESTTTLKGEIRTALSEQQVRKIVQSVLSVYDADKTGLVDFALESAGGQILSTRCTESYQTKTAQLSVFGIPLWYPTNTPRVAISPNVQPGECWAFQGFPGFLVLKLNSMVHVTGFTLEHIPKSLSPNGRIESAPRNFTVWGLLHEKDQEPILFGNFEYADNEASLQYFPVQNLDIQRPYDIVELRIETNHGHPQYTCLYRFRVHGKPPAA